MAKARSVGITIIIIIAVIIILGGGGWYIYNQATYVSSDDASVQGTIVTLAAPADGVLVDWHAPVGATVNKGMSLGRIDGSVRTQTSQPRSAEPSSRTTRWTRRLSCQVSRWAIWSI